jgi:hypothetical protein
MLPGGTLLQSALNITCGQGDYLCLFSYEVLLLESVP